jgi:hypothetical protein
MNGLSRWLPDGGGETLTLGLGLLVGLVPGAGVAGAGRAVTRAALALVQRAVTSVAASRHVAQRHRPGQPHRPLAERRPTQDADARQRCPGTTRTASPHAPLFGVVLVVAVDWLVFQPNRSIVDVEESLLRIVRPIANL